MKEFLEAITLRVRSPVFGYFCIAFLAFNWRGLLFIVVSSENPIIRIKYFEESTSLASTLWYPMAVAVLMGLIYPWINLAFLKIGALPARIQNDIYAETEHSHLLRKLKYERLRGEFIAEQERQLIEKSKRDEEVENISDPQLRKDLKVQIDDLRRKRFEDKDIGLIEATRISLEAIGIVVDKVSTTGGTTGVRIWISKDVTEKTLDFLHEEIVSLHGKPVALDVRDYKSDKVIYTRSRPKFLT